MVQDRTLNLGVIGWGGRGGNVYRDGYEATGGLVAAVACVEPSDEKYVLGCQRWKASPKRYRTVPEMIAREENLDAVIVASPNEYHLENLQDLEGSALPVLLEKPLDSTFEKICDVVRFARRYKAPILVGHCMRYAPVLQEAGRLLKSGAIGRICSVRFVQHCHYGNAGYHNWRRNKRKSGTWLIEKATHDFDVMNALLEDRPRAVSAIQKLQAFGGDKPDDLRCRNCPDALACPESMANVSYRWGACRVEELKEENDFCVFAREVDTPDNDACLIDFDGGVFGTYQQWFFSPRSFHHRVYELHGTEGAMEIDLGAEFGGKITICHRYAQAVNNDRFTYRFDYLGRNHYNGDGPMMHHFYRVVKEGEQPLSTVEQAFVAELVGYGAIRAAEEGRVVALRDLLPPDLKEVYPPSGCN